MGEQLIIELIGVDKATGALLAVQKGVKGVGQAAATHTTQLDKMAARLAGVTLQSSGLGRAFSVVGVEAGASAGAVTMLGVAVAGAAIGAAKLGWDLGAAALKADAVAKGGKDAATSIDMLDAAMGRLGQNIGNRTAPVVDSFVSSLGALVSLLNGDPNGARAFMAGRMERGGGSLSLIERIFGGNPAAMRQQQIGSMYLPMLLTGLGGGPTGLTGLAANAPGFDRDFQEYGGSMYQRWAPTLTADMTQRTQTTNALGQQQSQLEAAYLSSLRRLANEEKAIARDRTEAVWDYEHQLGERRADLARKLADLEQSYVRQLRDLRQDAERRQRDMDQAHGDRVQDLERQLVGATRQQRYDLRRQIEDEQKRYEREQRDLADDAKAAEQKLREARDEAKTEEQAEYDRQEADSQLHHERLLDQYTERLRLQREAEQESWDLQWSEYQKWRREHGLGETEFNLSLSSVSQVQQFLIALAPNLAGLLLQPMAIMNAAAEGS